MTGDSVHAKSPCVLPCFLGFCCLYFAETISTGPCCLYFISLTLTFSCPVTWGTILSFPTGFQELKTYDLSIELMQNILLTFVFMDVIDVNRKLLLWTAKIAQFASTLLWNFMHFLVTIWYFLWNLVHVLESFLVSHEFLKEYKALDVSKLRYLAIVIESDEARRISNVIELLQWVAAIGVKHVCLYDMEGVLKESREIILARCNARPWKGAETAEALVEPKLILEFTSVSDGKQGVEKAANLLFTKYQGVDQDKPKFTEALLDEALRLVGCSGPEPDLLLIYGPTRCHLGFPAWRIRYTELVHMGCLNSKKRGSLIKAIYRFTTVRQNYGT